MVLILIKRFDGASFAILFFSNLFHPVHYLAVLGLLDRDVRHGGCSRRAVPMFHTRWEPDNVAGPNLLHWAAFALSPAHAGRDNQRLPKRMGVPGGARTGLKGDTCGCCSRRVLRLK